MQSVELLTVSLQFRILMEHNCNTTPNLEQYPMPSSSSIYMYSRNAFSRNMYITYSRASWTIPNVIAK